MSDWIAKNGRAGFKTTDLASPKRTWKVWDKGKTEDAIVSLVMYSIYWRLVNSVFKKLLNRTCSTLPTWTPSLPLVFGVKVCSLKFSDQTHSFIVYCCNSIQRLPLLPICHAWKYVLVPQSREIHGQLFSRFEIIISCLPTFIKLCSLKGWEIAICWTCCTLETWTFRDGSMYTRCVLQRKFGDNYDSVQLIFSLSYLFADCRIRLRQGHGTLFAKTLRHILLSSLQLLLFLKT